METKVLNILIEDTLLDVFELVKVQHIWKENYSACIKAEDGEHALYQVNIKENTAILLGWV